MQLSVIGTVHAEQGRATAPELLALLQRLEPDVIFAEIPATHLEDYLSGQQGGLESSAVVRYCQIRKVEVLPVDLEKPPDMFFQDAKDMFRTVERTSRDYQRMIDYHSQLTSSEGFPYLNSDRCAQLWTDIHGEILDTLAWIKQPPLRKIYDRWRDQNGSRERAMVQAIEDFSMHAKQAHGVLLVGAAHRQPIIDIVRASIASGALSLRGNEELCTPAAHGEAVVTRK